MSTRQFTVLRLFPLYRIHVTVHYCSSALPQPLGAKGSFVIRPLLLCHIAASVIWAYRINIRELGLNPPKIKGVVLLQLKDAMPLILNKQWNILMKGMMLKLVLVELTSSKIEREMMWDWVLYCGHPAKGRLYVKCPPSANYLAEPGMSTWQWVAHSIANKLVTGLCAPPGCCSKLKPSTFQLSK